MATTVLTGSEFSIFTKYILLNLAGITLYSDGVGTGRLVFCSLQGQEIFFLSPRHSPYNIDWLYGWILFPAGAIVFLFSTASRSVLVPQTRVQ
jgi:hypothetical protein